MRSTFLLVGILATMHAHAAPAGDSLGAQQAVDEGMLDLLLECTAVRYPEVDTHSELIYVRVSDQQLLHLRHGRLVAQYSISTAKKGLGTQNGSERTPIGLHRIGTKIGEGVPAWGVLRERVFTGELAQGNTSANGDVITSRILWLDGAEAGTNKGGSSDSHGRYIYIHGTADEVHIGTPSSHGCIRMRNLDVITLFDAVAQQTPVLILP